MNAWAARAFAGGLAAIALSLSPLGSWFEVRGSRFEDGGRRRGESPPTSRLPPQTSPWTLVVTGDTDGYLSPCGCTEPMTGGIRRMASAVRKIGEHARVVLIDTGGLAGLPGIQSEYKAEAMAETLHYLDAAAINLTARDLTLGAETLSAVFQLAPGEFVGTNAMLPPGSPVQPAARRGQFLIGGVSSGSAEGVKFGDSVAAAKSLVSQAREAGLVSVLMLDGSRDEAVRLAGEVPGLGAIVYRRGGWPPEKAEHAGSVALLTPGEQGKAIVRAQFANGRMGGYAVTRLGPEWPDDPTVSRFYRTYLRRVDAARLLHALPRSPSDPFAGSAACAPCHAASYRIWQHSAHVHAYLTLEREGHGNDPDCVSCHVVGLASVGGFHPNSRGADLGAVGCESCHGPAERHAQNPKSVKLGTVLRTLCETCHTAEQSPNFSFRAYWPKISH